MANGKEMPFCLQSMVSLMITQVCEVLVVFVLACSPVTKKIKYIKEIKQSVQSQYHAFGNQKLQIEHRNSCGGDHHHLLCVVDNEWVESCLGIIPVIPLHRILDYKTVVFCKVEKDYCLVMRKGCFQIP